MTQPLACVQQHRCNRFSCGFPQSLALLRGSASPRHALRSSWVWLLPPRFPMGSSSAPEAPVACIEERRSPLGKSTR
eukprot:5403481-Alexandrium_andersonii.AAC.1